TRPTLRGASPRLPTVCPELQVFWPGSGWRRAFPDPHFQPVSARRSAIRETPLRLLAVFRQTQESHRVSTGYTMFADHHLLAVDAKAPALRDERFPHPPICLDLQRNRPNCAVHRVFRGRHFPPSGARRPELRETWFPPLTTYSEPGRA